MAVVIRDVLAQPAPESLHGHQVGAVAGQRRKLDAQVGGDLANGVGAVIGRAIPQHDQLPLGYLGPQPAQHVDSVLAIGARVGPEPFFDIGTEGGRTIKTASSRRNVPVHPELERVGLLRYRQHLLDRGASPQDPLWPDIKSDSMGRRAGPWSKWFNRYLRDKAGVDDAGKVFHSFRHTFKRMARDARLEEEVHDALTGHTGGGVGRSYGAGFGLKVLAEAVGRLEVPEVVRGLRWTFRQSNHRVSA
jgi:hypothetical protein